jgi:alpha-beta hydrolase superfamily lysophospholipase
MLTEEVFRDNITSSNQDSKNTASALLFDAYSKNPATESNQWKPLPPTQDLNPAVITEKTAENERNRQSDKTSHVELDENPTLAMGLATPCYKWQDKSVEPKGAVLLIHGFPAHGKVYDHLASKLAAEGYVVYAPDLRGLGRAYSTGLAPKLDYTGATDGDLAILADRIRKENKGLPLMVGGESMGGAFSIRLAALHPEFVDGLILSGAAIKNVPHYIGLFPQSFRNLVGPRHPQVDFSNQIRKYFSDDPRITNDLLRDPLVRKRFDVSELTQCRAVSRDTVGLVSSVRPNIPVLLLQSVDDMQTSARRSMRVYDHELRSTDFTPVILPPRGHILIESPYVQKDVEDTVVNWLNKKTRR